MTKIVVTPAKSTIVVTAKRTAIIRAAGIRILGIFDTIVTRRDEIVAYLTIAAPVSGVGFGQLDFSVTENSGLGALMGY